MLIDWAAIVQLGGVTALAMFSIWILQKTWEGRLADQKTTQEELTQQRETLMQIVKANTVAMTDLSRVSQESIASSRELCQEVRASIVTTTRARKVAVKGA